MLGIMLGVMVLITILSVMNGFEKELRDRILGVVAHVTVSETDGKWAEWAAEIDRLAAQEQVVGAAPYIQKQVMLSHNGMLRAVIVQGIDPAYQDQVSEVNLKMLAGGFQDLIPRGYGIILGSEVADELQAYPGDKVTVIVPQVQVTPAGVLPRVRRFTVVGVHQVGMQEFDGMTAFVHLDDAGRLFRMKGKASGVRLKLDDLFDAQSVAYQLQQDLGDNFEVKDWGQEHGNFFRAVKTEKIAMSMILFLVVGVALFNLVASLVMAVNDKQADIAILRTFGMSPGRIQRIFMIQGSIIGVFGTVVGVLLGVLLSLNIESIVAFFENLFGFKVFPGDVFYISDIPSDLHWDDVILIGVVSVIASVLATIYPAYRASKVQPAESLRYE